MNKLGEICQHGQLKRQCELCEKDEEIERLRAELEAANARIAEMRNVLVLTEHELCMQGCDDPDNVADYAVWTKFNAILYGESKEGE